jgi:hypothetical protein
MLKHLVLLTLSEFIIQINRGKKISTIKNQIMINWNVLHSLMILIRTYLYTPGGKKFNYPIAFLPTNLITAHKIAIATGKAINGERPKAVGIIPTNKATPPTVKA